MISKLKRFFRVFKYSFPFPQKYGYKSKTAVINYPVMITDTKNLYMHDYSLIQPYCKLVMGERSRIVIKKFSAIATGVTIVNHNHYPTVGVPHRFNGLYHINNVDKDIIIEEDCWVGANVSLLPGTHLGRGSIVGASAVVNKEIPPYAVVVGVPCKIVAVKFSIDDILKHEHEIYKPEERYTREQLESIFEDNFKDKKILYTSQDVNPEVLNRWMSVKKDVKFSELT